MGKYVGSQLSMCYVDKSGPFSRNLLVTPWKDHNSLFERHYFNEAFYFCVSAGTLKSLL